MKEVIEFIEGLRNAKGHILTSDFPKDDPRSKEEWHEGYHEALRHIESHFLLGYMVLGIKNYPCNPNDYGIVNEADNPYILGKESAEKLAQKVTLEDIKDHGLNEGYRALIVTLAYPKEVYFKG